MLQYLPRPMPVASVRRFARRKTSWTSIRARRVWTGENAHPTAGNTISSGSTNDRGRCRRGFTLLELLLALSLTVIVLVLVNMAVDLHLRSLDARRTQLEESQLARSILRMIADDLRGAVQHFEQDTSGIETLLQQSVASAAGSLGQAATDALGGAAAGSSGAAAAGLQGNANPGGSSSSNTSQSASSGGLGGSSGGASRGSTSPTSNTSASSSFSMSSTGSAGSASSEATGQNTEDLSTTTIPPVPGLFGNQYQLQVDVSRLPRIEEYQRYLTPDAVTSVVDIPSDVKTVTYFVQSTGAAPDLADSQSLADLSDPNANGTGLMRRELDRSVTLWAMNNGNYTGLQNSGDVIAPEVAAIEFQYFDGSEWLTEWDSEVEKKLPIAVLVILALRPPGAAPAAEVIPSRLTPETAGNLHLYRLLVNLPAGGQSAPEESSTVPSSPTTDSNAAASTGSATTGGSP